MDAIALQRGYALNVGDTLDPDRTSVIDIKNSINGGTIPKDQLAKLKSINANRPVTMVQSLRVFHNGEWKTVRRTQAAIKIFGIVGVAGTLYALTRVDTYDDQLEELVDAVFEVQEAEPGPQKRLAGAAAVQKMQAYLANFVPDDDALNVVSYLTLMRVLTDLTPAE